MYDGDVYQHTQSLVDSGNEWPRSQAPRSTAAIRCQTPATATVGRCMMPSLLLGGLNSFIRNASDEHTHATNGGLGRVIIYDEMGVQAVSRNCLEGFEDAACVHMHALLKGCIVPRRVHPPWLPLVSP